MAKYRIVNYGGSTNHHLNGAEFEWDGVTTLMGSNCIDAEHLPKVDEVELVVDKKPLVEVTKEEVEVVTKAEKVTGVTLNLKDLAEAQELFADLYDTREYVGLTGTGEKIYNALKEALNGNH